MGVSVGVARPALSGRYLRNMGLGGDSLVSRVFWGALEVLVTSLLDEAAYPTAAVLRRLSHLFLSAPVRVRPDRKSVRRKTSLCRSYHVQRHVNKNVF